MIQLDPFFQSCMVLPRNEVLPFWGIADPGSRVLLSLGSQKAETLSNADGVFKLWLSPLEAGGPYTVRICLPEKDEEQVLQDLWVGELWFASGQSNMSMTVEGCERYTEEMLRDADYPEVRLFKVEQKADFTPGSSVSGTWQVCQPGNVKAFSAVAFSFATALHQELKVPVGIVVSSWGGSIIEAWMSQQGLDRLPEFQAWAAEYRREACLPEHWQEFREKANEQGLVLNLPVDAGNRGWDEGWAEAEFDDREWAKIKVPGAWQMSGYTGSGVYWYRQSFEIPESWQGKRLVFEAGAIDKIDITYANGREIGRTGKGHEEAFWNQQRSYRIDGDVIRGRQVSLALRVVSFSGDGGMTGPASRMGLYPEGEPEAMIPVAGTWKIHQEQDYGIVSTVAVMGHGNHNSPHILFDNMVAPLLPFPFKGVIWYQGESNGNRAYSYESLLQGLIEDWRWQFSRPDLSFHIVQLPEYRSPAVYQEASSWAVIRDAQRRVAENPGVGLAVAFDYGEAEDIHPQNKIPVGRLLARSALAGVYDKDLLAGGPMIAEVQKEPTRVICRFRQAGEGLCVRDADQPDGFYLAGEDGEFHPAEAKILSADQVEVSTLQVKDPRKIRYAWADNPSHTFLRNSEGIPASTFGLSL